VRQRRTEEREREVDEGGPGCNFGEMQGPYCNASITFNPVLKWRWGQKQKCVVFQMYNFALRFIHRRAIVLTLTQILAKFSNFM
jgi:hypothetical protein